MYGVILGCLGGCAKRGLVDVALFCIRALLLFVDWGTMNSWTIR